MKIYDAIVMVPTKVRVKTEADSAQLTNVAHAAVDQMGGIGKTKPFLHSMEFVSEEAPVVEPTGLHLA